MNRSTITTWYDSSPVLFAFVTGAICGVFITLFAYIVLLASQASLGPSEHRFVESLYYKISTVGALVEDILGCSYTFAAGQSLTRHLLIISTTNAALFACASALTVHVARRRQNIAPTVLGDHGASQGLPTCQRTCIRTVCCSMLLGFSLGGLLTLFISLLMRSAPGGENIVTALMMLFEAVLYGPTKILAVVLGLSPTLPDLSEAPLSVILVISVLNGAVSALFIGLGVPFVNWLLKRM